MGFDTAYEAISEQGGDERWAFGAGFEGALSGLDAPVPPGVEGADLAAYCLMLGDDALVMSHRLQEWLTWAPELEEETALANIALDLLGQARMLLARAGTADGTGRDEDHYAFQRAEDQFRNVRLVEPPDPDFGSLVVRLLVFSAWRLALMARLTQSRDPVVAAIAAKAVKELAYHRDWAARWVVSLGDGTAYSHERIAVGLESVAPLVPELLRASAVERRLVTAAVAVDPGDVREDFEAVLASVLAEATAAWPEVPERSGGAGREGSHTEALAPLLVELQGLARSHPGATW